jgi:murein DD-endopeptidase MepM/ murein hydrolase activator NlpD
MIAGAVGALAVGSVLLLSGRGGTSPAAATGTPLAAAAGTTAIPGLPSGILGTPPPALELRPRLLSGSVLGNLVVPGLDQPIQVVEGLVESADSIGHDQTSAYPGEPHTMLLQAGQLVSLPRLQTGAVVQLAAVYGVFRYQVTAAGATPSQQDAADAPELHLLVGTPTQRTQLTATLLADNPQTAAELAEEVAVAHAQQDALNAGLVGATAPQRLIAPCQGPITQGFGPTSYAFEFPFVYQGVYYAHFHTGIDLGVPTGTPIHATAAGTVVLATTNLANGVPVGYGTYVVIAHGGGVYSLYGHLSALGVHAGQQVGAGEVIGLSGSTGNSTGPHLHFEIRKGTQPVDPLQLLD